jgi:hypothetical protein
MYTIANYLARPGNRQWCMATQLSLKCFNEMLWQRCTSGGGKVVQQILVNKK